MIFIKFALANC